MAVHWGERERSLEEEGGAQKEQVGEFKLVSLLPEAC